MTSINVFIGYDPRQAVAWNVLAHSIACRASVPVSITRLQLDQLPIKRKGLTEFTYSRFLVPYLSDFKGTSIFLDSDMLCLCDIIELLAYPLAYPTTPVFVVQSPKKFEWPSLMVFNNEHCKTLTPQYIETAALFNFSWTSEVGSLPKEYNHLVGYDPENPGAKIIHYTQGIPCWPETKDSEYAEDWNVEAKHMTSTVSFMELMGRSVHVPHVAKRLAAVKG